MNTELAIQTIEALEPYARRLIEQAERKDFQTGRWFLAWQQANLVIKAFDGLDGPLRSEPAGPPEQAEGDAPLAHSRAET